MKRKLAAILAFIMVLCTSINAMAGSYSLKWTCLSDGNWQVYKYGSLLKNTWVLDDECDVEGGVWYLIDENGNMVVAPLVHDGEGRYYSFNDQHDGHYGAMLTANGSHYGAKLNFEQNHNGGYGSITNADGIATLTAKYGVKEMPNIKNAATVKLSEVNRASSDSSDEEDSTVYYKVNFDLNGVSVTTPSNYKEQSVAEGQHASEPVATPSDVSGLCDFAGWFHEDTEWDFEADEVTEDITLTAYWNCKVTFDANGGSFAEGTTVTEKYAVGALISEPAAEPTKSGVAFGGWYKEAACTNAWDFYSDTATPGLILYAKWNVPGYELDKFNFHYYFYSTYQEECNLVLGSHDELAGYLGEQIDRDISKDGSVKMYKGTGTYADSNSILVVADGDHAVVFPEDSEELFSCFKHVKKIDLQKVDASKVTNMKGMFNQCDVLESIVFPSDFNTANVTDMGAMFLNDDKLQQLDLSSFDTQNVTDMHNMFASCQELTTITGLDQLDTGKVTTMQGMFDYNYKLQQLDLSSFNTENVTDMTEMFCKCYALTTITGLDHLNTANVTTMQSMFSYCKELTAADVSNFNTAKVTNMNGMFNCCFKLTQLDLTSFDTANVTNMATMFNMYDYYDNRSNLLTTIYASDKFVTTSVTADADMFNRCNSLEGKSGGKTIKYSTVKNKTKEYARVCSPTVDGYFTAK